jgi:hypothetical protein
MLKILLNAVTSPNLGLTYGLLLVIISIVSVKIVMTWRQSAGVRSLSTSEASQRLNAEDLVYAYLVGLLKVMDIFLLEKKENI